MIVTINTDASFRHDHKVGSYAFWITSDKGRIKKSGILKGKQDNPIEAEFKCILNALYTLGKLGYEDIDKIVINTDALQVIDYIKSNKQKTNKRGNPKSSDFNSWRYLLLMQYNEYVKKFGFKGKIDLRHVKAHTQNTDSRSFVNKWCDKEAGSKLKKYLADIKISINFEPSN